jgi:predicted alpha/beta hydrolase family esterase
MSSMEKILIVPGLHNSGPSHWQTWFQSRVPDTWRVEQPDWQRTCLSDWAQRVREEIDGADAPVWIVAHSFGCLAAVTAAFARPEAILGALLVAPADPDRFRIPHVLLEEKLAFPSLVVASETDPWVHIRTARDWAERWGSDFANIGPAGHINVDSGHGPWPEGLRFFEKLRGKAKR